MKNSVTLQEIYYKIEITFKNIDSLENTFSGLFTNLVISNKKQNSAVLEITTESSINPFYTKKRIKRIIIDKLYTRALFKIESIKDLEFKEEAEIYNLEP